VRTGEWLSVPRARGARRVGRRVRVLRRDLDQLLAEAEASATSASQPGADAGQDGQGWPDAQAFWGGR
jgi:hypothetical protein